MIPGYYTTEEVAYRFGWQHRQQVATIAKREEWGTYSVGNAHLYLAIDVDEYAQVRQRTELAKVAGWSGRGLIRHSKYDCICPECEAFAVMIKDNIVCERGHKCRQNDILE